MAFNQANLIQDVADKKVTGIRIDILTE